MVARILSFYCMFYNIFMSSGDTLMRHYSSFSTSRLCICIRSNSNKTYLVQLLYLFEISKYTWTKTVKNYPLFILLINVLFLRSKPAFIFRYIYLRWQCPWLKKQNTFKLAFYLLLSFVKCVKTTLIRFYNLTYNVSLPVMDRGRISTIDFLYHLPLLLPM